MPNIFNWCEVWTLLLQSRAVATEASRGVTSSCQKDNVLMGANVVLKPACTFLHWWCLHRCVCCPWHIGINVLTYCTIGKAGFSMGWIKGWMVPLLLNMKDVASLVSQKNFKFLSFNHKTVFHISLVHFKWALDQWRLQFLYGAHFFYRNMELLHFWMTWWVCVYWQTFVEVFLGPCSDVHTESVFNHRR